MVSDGKLASKGGDKRHLCSRSPAFCSASQIRGSSLSPSIAPGTGSPWAAQVRLPARWCENKELLLWDTCQWSHLGPGPSSRHWETL